jgi:hypothetical protein
MSHPFTIIDVPQRSPEWFSARAGRLTSSNADCLFKEGKKKGEESYQRRDLRIRLALERMTGQAQDDETHITAAMQRGIDREADARLAYEAEMGVLVEQSGFLAHASAMAGTSLDGHVDDFDGIVELKCPKSATHIGYLKSKEIPPEYLPQIRHHVWITGAQWADFVSFDDRLPEHLRLVMYRVTRAQLDIPGYEAAALAFLKDVDAEIAALSALRQTVAA